MTSQFEGAERIADKWGITRQDTDEFGLRSQQLAAQAWAEDRFATQIVPVTAPDADDEGNLLDTTHTVTRDEGLRETTLEKLATLKPVARPDGVHTAGSASQISDGAAAVLLMTADKAKALGLTPQGPHRRHLPRRRRPRPDAHRPDRRHQPPAAPHRHDDGRHRRVPRSTRRSPRSCSPGPRSSTSTWPR